MTRKETLIDLTQDCLIDRAPQDNFSRLCAADCGTAGTPSIKGGALMLVNVPELDAQKAGLQTIAVGQVGNGPITVDKLVVSNVDLDVKTGPIVLHEVEVTLKLELAWAWRITIPMPWPFKDLHLGGSGPLGTFALPQMPVGPVTIPFVSNIKLNIPSLTGSALSASASPLSNLQLQNASADTIRAKNVALPSAGFSIAGLLLNSIQGTDVTLPAASVGTAEIDHIHGDPLHIPQFSLGPVTLGNTEIPLIQSAGSVDVDSISLKSFSVHIPAGLLDVTFTVTPTADSHIDQLEISNATASVAVANVVLEDVVLPYDVLNLTLSQVGINNIAIPAFSVV